MVSLLGWEDIITRWREVFGWGRMEVCALSLFVLCVQVLLLFIPCVWVFFGLFCVHCCRGFSWVCLLCL